MKNLDNKKNDNFKNIPSNHMKDVSEVTVPCLTNIWNTHIKSEQTFPVNLKLADINPVFKKEDSILTKNYRPVSVLPVVSKTFERQLQIQIISYMDQFLYDYRKGYSIHYHILISSYVIIEKFIVFKLH